MPSEIQQNDVFAQNQVITWLYCTVYDRAT